MRPRLLLAVAAAVTLIGPATAQVADPPIVMEVRGLTRPGALLARAGITPAAEALTDAQLRQLVEAAQGNPQVSMTQTPKITLPDGQERVIRATRPQSFL